MSNTSAKLWLDDQRRPPDDTWDWARNFMDAVSFVLLNGVPFDEMSLDHDLGDHEPTGLDFLRWLVINQAQLLPRVIRIHSANPVGTMNMRQTLERAGVYTKHTLHGTGWEREDL